MRARMHVRTHSPMCWLCGYDLRSYGLCSYGVWSRPMPRPHQNQNLAVCRLCSYGLRSYGVGMADLFTAYVFMAYVVMAYVVMAHQNQNHAVCRLGAPTFIAWVASAQFAAQVPFRLRPI